LEYVVVILSYLLVVVCVPVTVAFIALLEQKTYT